MDPVLNFYMTGLSRLRLKSFGEPSRIIWIILSSSLSGRK
jgi:hypothetical protein